MICGKGIAASIATFFLATGVAAAQMEPDPGLAAPPGEDATLRDTPGVTGEVPKLLPGSRGATEGDLGEHQVTGRVTSIDKTQGKVSIDAKGKDLQLLFPPSALEKLDRGDEVTVTLSLHRNPTKQRMD